MSKFTPGPWEVVESRNGYPYQISARTASDNIAGAVGKSITRWAAIALPSSEEGQANARLIAAAPELYEALSTLERLSRKVLEMFDGPRILTGAWDACDAARAALAKVQGSPTCTSSGSSDTGAL